MKRSIFRDCLRIARTKNGPDSHPEFGKFQHFSFVIQNNKIVEWGTNMPGSPLTKYGYPEYGKTHSENLAYLRARGLLDHTKLWEVVNVRLNKKNEVRLSKPCNCCMGYLSMLGCKEVWFTTQVGWARVRLNEE